MNKFMTLPAICGFSCNLTEEMVRRNRIAENNTNLTRTHNKIPYQEGGCSRLDQTIRGASCPRTGPPQEWTSWNGYLLRKKKKTEQCPS